MKSERWRKCNTKSRLGTFHVIMWLGILIFELRLFLWPEVTGGYFVIFQELRKFRVPASNHMFTTVSGMFMLLCLSRMFSINWNSALPWKPSSNVTFTRKPSGIYWNETSADSSILSEHVLFFFFFSFLDLAPSRPSLEFHPLSRLSCSNLLTLKQTGSLFCICIGLSMLVGKGEQYHFKTWWKSKLNS